jgi:hypothetical protein
MVQPDAPPNLRGAIYVHEPIGVGDVQPIPRRSGVEFWKAIRIEEDADPSWAGLIHFGYAPRTEWPDLTQEELDAYEDVRRATAADFEPWMGAAAENPVE